MQFTSRDPGLSRASEHGRGAAVLGGQYRWFFGAPIAAVLSPQSYVSFSTGGSPFGSNVLI